MSDHFDGAKFHNVPAVTKPGLGGLLRWQLLGRGVSWPSQAANSKEPTRPDARVDDGRIRVTFVNHATTLIQMDGVNILTDPVWSNRVGPTSWLGPKRYRDPGIRFEDLPPIDAVLVSHSHYDHCDVPTLRRLEAAFHPTVLAGLGSEAMLAEHGVHGVADLDWWKMHAVSTVRVTFVPAQHWSNRGIGDVETVLWGAFVLEGPSGRVYFAGDTGFGPHFAAVRARVGAPDVALLPIGAYEPRWFMGVSHMSPADAVEAHRVLGAKRSMGIHWLTFDQTDEGQYQPAGDLGTAAREAGLAPGDFVAIENGERIEFVTGATAASP